MSAVSTPAAEVSVAFVGFVGGWLKQALAPDALFLGGALAAIVVTFFTFLPFFVCILAGGPVVEATHGKLWASQPRCRPSPQPWLG